MKNTVRSTPRPLEKLLASSIDAGMLREIASADYGEDVNEHFLTLVAALAGPFVVPLKWEPIEVLELVRWSEPADRVEDGQLIRKSEREHWMRLFCCTVLLKTSSQAENHEKLISEDSTIIQFVHSAIELGDKTTLAAIEFLEWLIGKSHSDCPFCPIALAILGLSLNDRDSSWANALVNTGTNSALLRNLISECQLANSWRVLLQKTLIDPNNCDSTREFGQSLVAS
jgi:hypothetical protein